MLSRRELLVTAAAQAAAPGEAARPANPFAELQESGLYLPALMRYREQLARVPKGPDRQSYAQALAMVGEAGEAYREERQALFGGPPIVGSVGRVRSEEALDAIARASVGRRVVILNEAHTSSRSRAFVHAAALRLASEGFFIFAAETFAAASGDFTRLQGGRGPVTTRVGFYSSDPVYAEMLRDLRDRGWRFAAYEQRPDQDRVADSTGAMLDGQAAREEAEAQNLAALLRQDRGPRVLVLCGQGHGIKRRGELALMGQRLAALGFDPLSVDQTFGLPGPTPAEDASWYATLAAAARPSRSVAVFHAIGRPAVRPGADPRAYDLVVLHPRVPDVQGRPGWLAAAPGRKSAPVDVPEGLPAGALIQAVPLAETVALNVVPADQFLLPTANLRRAVLMLRPGGYELRVETAEGRRALGRFQVAA